MTILSCPRPKLSEVSLGNCPKCNSQAHGVESKQKVETKGNQENKQSLKMAAKYGHWVATIYKDSTSEPNLEPGFEPWSCQHWIKPG